MTGSSDTPTEFERLQELNQQIERLERETRELETDRRAAAKGASRAAWWARYLHLARWFRSPATTFDMWRMVVMIVGPFAVGMLLLILADQLFGAFFGGVLVFLFGLAVGAMVCFALLYRPPDALLPAALKEADAERGIADSRHQEAVAHLADGKDALQKALDERQQLVTSDKLQRAMLLQRSWKAMRDEEWEDYLVEVCRTLGAKVERTGRVGDQGVDLVVEFGDRRIAVQAKGYYHAVNSAAVQQAVAGMAHYGCNACAAITNSRFTPGAKELAASNGCTLIGEDEFPDFVMGKVMLTS